MKKLRHQVSSLPPPFHLPHSNLAEPKPPRETTTPCTMDPLARRCVRLRPPYLKVGVMTRSRNAQRWRMVHTAYGQRHLAAGGPRPSGPFVPPEVVSEVSVDDDDVDAKAARTTLRNICIASSTAAILAVFLVLVLVAEFSLPHIDIGTSEIPRVVDRFHSGDPGIAASLKHINTPEATRTAARPPTPSTSRPRRVTSRQRAFPTVPKRTATTTTRRMTKEKTSTRRP
ncbi:hypothetical protein MRX96_044170, partial [Rhipicephalus microplus]